MAQVNIDGINLAFDDTGSGRPVILLHGYPFNRTLWDSQVAALKNNFRVITPDLRGFGDSDAAEPATMARMAEDLARLMDALDIPSAIIGGLSNTGEGRACERGCRSAGIGEAAQAQTTQQMLRIEQE